MVNKKGFNIIELLFCIFVLSIFTLTVVNAVAFNIKSNKVNSSYINAYILADNLLKVEIAFHEYLGILWAYLRNEI